MLYKRKVIVIVKTERLLLFLCVSFVAVILRIKCIFRVLHPPNLQLNKNTKGSESHNSLLQFEWNIHFIRGGNTEQKWQ